MQFCGRILARDAVTADCRMARSADASGAGEGLWELMGRIIPA
jgi:hypothetical protein